LYAYALSQSGSDWCYAKVRNVASGEDFSEKIEWLKFTGLSFTHDNKGFFYQRLPEPVGTDDAGTERGANKNAMVKQMRNFSEESYYHVLGTDQSADILIHSDKENPEYMFSTAVTFDGEWLRLSITKNTSPTNKLWLAKLDGTALPTKSTCPISDGSHTRAIEMDQSEG
jgi:prolyl oligopeptidase